MRPVFALFAAVALTTTPTLADEAQLAAHRATADSCWASVSGHPERVPGCADLVFDACTTMPAGQSNLGMSQCLYTEAEFWDEKLNEEWRRLMPRLRAADEADRAYDPELAVREDTLRTAQRAWIAFRDAQCAFDYAMAGGGTIRQLFHPACLADLTRKRVRDLLAIGQEFGL